MLTRKHFRQAAENIKELKMSTQDGEVVQKLYDQWVKMFRQSNPRFDENKFRRACGF